MWPVPCLLVKRSLLMVLDIFEHHPVHDQIAVDIMLDGDDPDTLVKIGSQLEKNLQDSGLVCPGWH